MTELIERLRCRIRAMTADEWIVCAAAAAILLPDIAAGVILAGIGVSALVRPKCLRRLTAINAFWVIAVLLPLLTIPAAVCGNYYGMLIGVVLFLIMTFMLYAASVMTIQLLSNIFDLLLTISMVAALYGVYCQHMRIFEMGRVGSIFENPNYWGYSIELYVLIALCQFLRKGHWIYLLVLTVNLLCNILCDCRSAWVCILAAVTVFGLMYLRKLWLLGAAAGIGACFLVLARFVPDIGERLTAEAIAKSLSNRIVYWNNAWNWFLERPLFGWGPMSYEMLSEQRGEKVLAHAHNLYLNILLDSGIVGAAAVVVMSFLVLRGLLRREKDRDIRCFRCLVTAACTATLLHSVTDVTLLGVSTSVIFVLIMSGVYVTAPDKAEIGHPNKQKNPAP